MRGYEEGLCALRDRIVALRREREAEVEKLKRKRERAWAIERGSVAVVLEDDEEGLVGSDSNPEDAHSKIIRINKHYTPAETPFNDDEHRWQCPSRPAPCWSRSKNDFLPPSQPQPQPLRRQPAKLMVANLEILEARGGDITNNCFRVSTNNLEGGQIREGWEA